MLGKILAKEKPSKNPKKIQVQSLAEAEKEELAMAQIIAAGVIYAGLFLLLGLLLTVTSFFPTRREARRAGSHEPMLAPALVEPRFRSAA